MKPNRKCLSFVKSHVLHYHSFNCYINSCVLFDVSVISCRSWTYLSNYDLAICFAYWIIYQLVHSLVDSRYRSNFSIAVTTYLTTVLFMLQQTWIPPAEMMAAYMVRLPSLPARLLITSHTVPPYSRPSHRCCSNTPAVDGFIALLFNQLTINPFLQLILQAVGISEVLPFTS